MRSFSRAAPASEEKEEEVLFMLISEERFPY
jgi:hypothetical protein